MTDRQPIFIAFEGGEGSGKTTQAALLTEAIRATGRAVTLTHEPGDTPLGRELREMLLNQQRMRPVTGWAEAMLFAADRAAHTRELIWPALQAGKVVICDRFEDSSIAYQGYGRELGPRNVEFVSGLASNGIRPDLVVLLDIAPAVGIRRVETRGQQSNRIDREDPAFHERVRTGFLDLAAREPDRYLLLDATWPVADLHRKIRQDITRRFGLPLYESAAEPRHRPYRIRSSH